MTHDSTVPPPAASLGLDPGRLDRIQPWMQSWVDSGRLAGLSVLVHRRGHTAWFGAAGHADRERGLPMAADSVVRIYSMTKPLTSVALMMLYEEGRFQLDDPIATVLPEFAAMRVVDGDGTVPAERGITYRDLLTHTAGLTYGFHHATPTDAAYRDTGVDFQTADATLGEVVARLAKLPLLFQPGTRWNYSVATDVIGHLVAVHSGLELGQFLTERVLRPLGMTETGFAVTEAQLPRFAANYARGEDGRAALLDDPVTSRFRTQRLASGGGGLVGTIGDYMRFCRFLLGGGALEGVRLLGRKTVALMMSNHLGGDLASMGQARFSESTYEGIGFGLGFSVMLDPARAQIVGTPGECAWGGAASTAFWVDPTEEMAVVMFAQLTPSSTYPIRRELRVLTYAALVD
ncbi:MAG: serine hydrolase domain-containing protein [Janthinobacterium lividum]